MIQQAITKYIDLIIGQLMIDMNFFNAHFGWMCFILPLVIWFFIMVLKYIVLLSPILLPLNMLSSVVKKGIKTVKK